LTAINAADHPSSKAQPRARALIDRDSLTSRPRVGTSRDHSPVASVRIRRAEEIQDLARAAFDAYRRDVVALLPAAEVEHVGATAVPGALTKGNVDLLVRVPERDFAEAVLILRKRYVVHQPHNWTRTLASFKAPGASDPPVGIQLVVAGSDADGFFGPFRDALINDPALLADVRGFAETAKTV